MRRFSVLSAARQLLNDSPARHSPKIRESQRARFAGAALACTAALLACAPELDTTRQIPRRGTVGEEVYGVLCDRTAAGALSEDMTGESFRSICHKQNGAFSDVVDETKLPAISADAHNVKGEPVPVDKQKADRAVAVGRITALVRRRQDLIAALDVMFPDIKTPIKDLKNSDSSKSCDAPAISTEGPLLDELAAMLGRFTDLYVDNTIPESTRSLGKVLTAFEASQEAREAWSQMEPRKGYRPAQIALGVARPAVSYPGLRDLTNSLLKVISADSKPYDPAAQYDDQHNRIEVPGTAYPQFSKVLESAHLELQNATIDPVSAALTVTREPQSGVAVLSRPRTSMEVMQAIMLAQDPAFGGGDPRYIVKRDTRGYALVPLANGAVPAPFMDTDGDKLPDLNPVGQFKVASGEAPSPFFVIGGDTSIKRDAMGRATPNGALVYDYIDTSKTFAAQVLLDTGPLVTMDAQGGHETLMDSFAGVSVLVGARDGDFKTERKYADGGSVVYNQIKPDDSPLLDASYALMQLLGDKSMDDTLQITKQLFEQNPKDMARLVGALMAARDLSVKYPNAKIPKTDTFWDEALDQMVRMAKVPNLLEDVLDSLAADDSALLGASFGQYAKDIDQIQYNRNDLNGTPLNLTTQDKSPPKTAVNRAKADTTTNRSILQRFLQLMADAQGVTACNRDGAIVHAKVIGLSLDLPTFAQNPYKECGVFKIENLAAFFVDAVAGLPGKGQLIIRDSFMRNGVGGLGAASTSLMEKSSGFIGFWGSGTDLRAKPEWLSRLVFFDQTADSPNSGDPNYDSNRFIKDLNGAFMGTNVCQERVIDDPCADGGCNFGGSNPIPNDVAPDKKIRGLRNCGNGDWLQQRDPNTLFALEMADGYKAIRPLAAAFSKNNATDVFVSIAAAAHRHYQTAAGTPAECKGAYVTGKGNNTCAKAGMSSYEALLSDILLGDIMPALTSLSKNLRAIQVKRCTAASKGVCTATTSVSGISALAEATRAMIDPDYAKPQGLKDRKGVVTSKRNDGTSNPQTTTLYLLLNALSNVDDAYDKWAVAHPDDIGRHDQWRRARSQLADQFFKVNGTGTVATFANASIPKVTPLISDVLRSQLWAHCPTSFAPPYDRCVWAKDDLQKKVTDSVTGPLFASGIDLMDGIRLDPDARHELEKVMAYMVSQASTNDAFAATLAAMADILQILPDEKNVIPLIRVLAAATNASVKGKDGTVTEKSLIDANLALLGKINGKYIDRNNQEICSHEVDPTQILPILLKNAVSPMTTQGLEGKTPIEVLIDIVADINRVAPNEPKPKLDATDYQAIASQTVDFLTNKERGLEQFYEIVRKGVAARKEQE